MPCELALSEHVLSQRETAGDVYLLKEQASRKTDSINDVMRGCHC